MILQVPKRNLSFYFLVVPSLLILLLLYGSSVIALSFSVSSPSPPSKSSSSCTTSSSSCINTLPTNSSPYVSNVLEWLDAESISWHFFDTSKIPFQYLQAITPTPTSAPTSTASTATLTTFVELDKSSILLHLIPTPRNSEEVLPPTLNKKLTEWVSSVMCCNCKKIIHLHEDVWIGKNEIVKSRLLVQSSGYNHNHGHERIFARKTMARRINATEARTFLIHNHLWGATKAKHHYGLFRLVQKTEEEEEKPSRRRRRRKRKQQSQEELVAVATFSKCRKVQRGTNNNQKLFNSFELLRYCSLKDSTVIGGISKLYKKFIRDVQPDDIVTLVDRDWGEATGWHTSLPFESMTILDPLVMVVSPLEPGVRRYLVGRGLQNLNISSSSPSSSSHAGINKSATEEEEECNNNNHPAQLAQSFSCNRLGLPKNTWMALNATSDPRLALLRLAQDRLYPVWDAGVERLYMVVSSKASKNNNTTTNTHHHHYQDLEEEEESTTKLLWRTAQPKYTHRYYSSNSGIFSLIKYAATGSPPLDSKVHFSHLDSWRKTSSSSPSTKLIFSAPSSMNPDDNATIEVRQRTNGWRTMRFFSSGSSTTTTKKKKKKKKLSSIYHSIFKVDPNNDDQAEPEVVIQDHLKTMAVLSLMAGLGRRQQQHLLKIENQQSCNGNSKKKKKNGEDPPSPPPPLRFLHFGYGAGTLVRLIAHYVTNSHHVAVELDQAVVDAAKYTLPDLPNVSIIAKDAVHYVKDFGNSNHHHDDDDVYDNNGQHQRDDEDEDDHNQRFDCICIDVFDENNSVPKQFYSTWFLRKLYEELLTLEGILVCNFHSGGKKRRLVIETATEAISSVFHDVCCVPSIDSTPTGGNVILLASKVSLPEDGDGTISLIRNALRVQNEFGVSFDAVARVQCAERGDNTSV